MKSSVTLGNMQVAYQEQGDGPPLLAVHCSSASSNEWSFLTNHFGKDYRILAPDLLGYGRSSAWPSTGELPATTDVDVLEAMLAKAAAPVHLVGHSYGGAVCLEVARRHAQSGQGSIRSLFLIEPVAFYVLNSAAHDKEWQEISRIGRRCIAACDAGNYSRAAAVFMSYWLGHLKWWLAARRMHVEVSRTIPKVAHEFREMFRFPVPVQAYADIGCPVTFVYGKRTRRPAKAVIDVLHQVLPQSVVLGIPAAGHMSPFTHKQAVIDLLEAHLDRQTALSA